MLWHVSLILMLLAITWAKAALIELSRRARESTSSVFRPFPYIQSVRFANEECLTASGFVGTCYTAQECDDLRGLSHGECADGYGVCCFLTYTCRETVHHNISYFVSPSYPGKEEQAGVCPLKVAFEPNICQIRLDFALFDILGPKDGDCLDDMFVILERNANHKVPIVCGENTNQHMFINVDTVESPIELQMITGIASYARDWRIKISMISCDDHYKAPVGCLQYHTGIVGNIRSFNFNQQNESRLGYLNGADYAICLRRERDMCSVTYSLRTEKDRLVSAADGNNSTPYDAPEVLVKTTRDHQSSKTQSFDIATSDNKQGHFQAAAGLTKCTSDYLAIPSLGRFCGGAFSLISGSQDSQSVTVKNSGPPMVLFKSDKASNGHGFNINFQQGPCTPLVAQAFF